jgi:hypothetical protein
MNGGGFPMMRQMGSFNHNNSFNHKRNRSATPGAFGRYVDFLPKPSFAKVSFSSNKFSGSTISPERRRQLEAERKKREEYENNFKCEVQESCPSDVLKLMRGNDVYNIG